MYTAGKPNKNGSFVSSKYIDGERKNQTKINISTAVQLKSTPLIMPQIMYRDADKFLTRPGRKQATATEDFDFHISYL